MVRSALVLGLLTGALAAPSPVAYAQSGDPAGGVTVANLSTGSGTSPPSVRATAGSSCVTEPQPGGGARTVCGDAGYPLPKMERLGVLPGDVLQIQTGEPVQSATVNLRDARSTPIRTLEASPAGGDGRTWRVVLPEGPVEPTLGVFLRFQGGDADYEAGLEDLSPAPVRPRVVRRRGGALSTFRIRYRATGESPYTVDVSGPAGTRCGARLAAIRNTGVRAGVQTIDIGPRAPRADGSRHFSARPVRRSGRAQRIRRWCPGVYRGAVYGVVSGRAVEVARFSFRVSR